MFLHRPGRRRHSTANTRRSGVDTYTSSNVELASFGGADNGSEAAGENRGDL